ncbi:hypothetical protein PAPYR_1384 [Paratrimastix pyriformis]|uniref:Uncharacterized protein n=1 Tax=Paratrimastix pyriformis TaxID=342808 RepID=A0ABQ8UUY9_9EUKA|nr:hypothetical protein PAPYR_1384 [Paratrimastix pyriformis]
MSEASVAVAKSAGKIARDHPRVNVYNPLRYTQVVEIPELVKFRYGQTSVPQPETICSSSQYDLDRG